MEASAEARVRIHVRWRDLDMLGHLNQAVYHEFLEEARSALFTRLDHSGDFAFVLARVELDYRHEVRRDHEAVDVTARVTRIGTKSLTVDHEVLLPDGTLAAEGRSILVAWDRRTRGSRAFSPEERERLGAAIAPA
jgi:acyl-CoA thioester hydrolase